MAQQFIWIIFILLSFSACVGEPTYYRSGDNFYKQRIMNSSKVLYKYWNYGDFAWSEWHSGEFILDSTENVNQANSIKDLLPLYYTQFILDSDTIEAIELCYTDKPYKKGVYEKTVNGIAYKVKRYYTKISNNMRLSYIYQNLTETEDSIFFEKLTTHSKTVKLPDNTGFRKGNVTIEEDSLGFIKKYKIENIKSIPFMGKNCKTEHYST